MAPLKHLKYLKYLRRLRHPDILQNVRVCISRLVESVEDGAADKIVYTIVYTIFN